MCVCFHSVAVQYTYIQYSALPAVLGFVIECITHIFSHAIALMDPTPTPYSYLHLFLGTLKISFCTKWPTTSLKDNRQYNMILVCCRLHPNEVLVLAQTTFTCPKHW